MIFIIREINNCMVQATDLSGKALERLSELPDKSKIEVWQNSQIAREIVKENGSFTWIDNQIRKR